MSVQKIRFSQLKIFGEFLSLGYSDDANQDQQVQLLKTILSDWVQSEIIAHENRILTNIIAITVEAPHLFGSLSDQMKPVFRLQYMENWRRSELIKKQLVEASNAFADADNDPVIMIKGGLRIFDNLYPTITHRYMADLDLYFEDRALLSTLAETGYESTRPDEFDLKVLDHTYIDWNKSQDHHLPPIYNPKRPCALEMHQHMVNLRAVDYCRPDPFSRTIAIPSLPKIFAPSPVDEMILNLLHSKYGDMFTDYSNFRLRNIFEGYLLYQRLLSDERNEFESYFKSIGLQQDLDFWKSLCVQLFSAKEFNPKMSLPLRTKFIWHTQFGQSKRANTVLYMLYFLYRLFFKIIWTQQGRKQLIAKLNNPVKRQVFWDKIKRMFRA